MNKKIFKMFSIILSIFCLTGCITQEPKRPSDLNTNISLETIKTAIANPEKYNKKEFEEYLSFLFKQEKTNLSQEDRNTNNLLYGIISNEFYHIMAIEHLPMDSILNNAETSLNLAENIQSKNILYGKLKNYEDQSFYNKVNLNTNINYIFNEIESGNYNKAEKDLFIAGENIGNTYREKKAEKDILNGKDIEYYEDEDPIWRNYRLVLVKYLLGEITTTEIINNYDKTNFNTASKNNLIGYIKLLILYKNIFLKIDQEKYLTKINTIEDILKNYKEKYPTICSDLLFKVIERKLQKHMQIALNNRVAKDVKENCYLSELNIGETSSKSAVIYFLQTDKVETKIYLIDNKTNEINKDYYNINISKEIASTDPRVIIRVKAEISYKDNFPNNFFPDNYYYVNVLSSYPTEIGIVNFKSEVKVIKNENSVTENPYLEIIGGVTDISLNNDLNTITTSFKYFRFEQPTISLIKKNGDDISVIDEKTYEIQRIPIIMETINSEKFFVEKINIKLNSTFERTPFLIKISTKNNMGTKDIFISVTFNDSLNSKLPGVNF